MAAGPRLAAVPPGVAWEEIDWSSHEADAWIDGRRLHYCDYGAGPAIMLVHGLGMSWQWWLENIPALGDGLRVIAVDLPGFGASDSLPLPAAMETHAEVLLELADRLELGVFTVLGHSMGGLVSLAMVERSPDRVGRVVLVNAGGVPLSDARLRGVVAVMRLLFQLLSRPGVMTALTMRPRLRHWVLRVGLHNASAVTPALAARVMPSLAGPGFIDAVSAAARRVRHGVYPLNCPVLIIWGAHDRLLPLSAARQLALDLPQAVLEILDDAGHTPMVEEPARFNALVARFCQEDQI